MIYYYVSKDDFEYGNVGKIILNAFFKNWFSKKKEWTLIIDI